LSTFGGGICAGKLHIGVQQGFFSPIWDVLEPERMREPVV